MLLSQGVVRRFKLHKTSSAKSPAQLFMSITLLFSIQSHSKYPSPALLCTTPLVLGVQEQDPYILFATIHASVKRTESHGSRDKAGKKSIKQSYLVPATCREKVQERPSCPTQENT